MDIIKAIEEEQMRTDLPNIQTGDFVRIHLKVKEGTRERIQIFEGTVIAIQGKGLTETFTVRRVSYGIGVERTIPLHSPKIDHIEVVRKGSIRRAKLYYLRKRVGKAARVKTKLAAKATMALPEDLKIMDDMIAEEQVPVDEAEIKSEEQEKAEKETESAEEKSE